METLLQAYVVSFRPCFRPKLGGSLFNWNAKRKENLMRFSLKSAGTAALVAVGTLLTPVFAQESGGSSATAVEIPDGLDMAGAARTMIGDLTDVIAVVVGGVIAFMLVRAAIKWIRSMK